jgi:DNA-binding NtrC family response regulator
MSRRILVIDDGVCPFEPLLNECGVPGVEVVRCVAKAGGLPAPSCAPRADLLVSIAFEPKQEWIGFFIGLASCRSPTPILAILRRDTSGELLAAAARVADDFLLWDSDRLPELQQRITRLLGPAENTAAISENLTRSMTLAKMIGEDRAFLATVAKIPIVARSDSVVLILGETGTGKELCAREVHHLSARSHLPFIPVDCAGHCQVERKYAHRLKVADCHTFIFGPQKRASRPITPKRSFPSNAPILPQLDNAGP